MISGKCMEFMKRIGYTNKFLHSIETNNEWKLPVKGDYFHLMKWINANRYPENRIKELERQRDQIKTALSKVNEYNPGYNILYKSMENKKDELSIFYNFRDKSFLKIALTIRFIEDELTKKCYLTAFLESSDPNEASKEMIYAVYSGFPLEIKKNYYVDNISPK